MNNTWSDFIDFKIQSFKGIKDRARTYASVFCQGPMDTKTFNDYVQTVGYGNAMEVNQCRAMTPIGWRAHFFFQWLFFWDKDAWWNEELNQRAWEDPYEPR